MTFAEYNTDENFENPKSSLEELVKIGKSEGKTKDRRRSMPISWAVRCRMSLWWVTAWTMPSGIAMCPTLVC